MDILAMQLCAFNKDPEADLIVGPRNVPCTPIATINRSKSGHPNYRSGHLPSQLLAHARRVQSAGAPSTCWSVSIFRARNRLQDLPAGRRRHWSDRSPSRWVLCSCR